MNLIDQAQIASGFVPVDTQTGGNVGDVVNLAGYNHLTVVFFKAAGAANDDPVLTFEQGTDVAFGTSKNLATITEYWRKEGADLAAIGTFTNVTQSASQTVTLSATSAESQGLYVFEVDEKALGPFTKDVRRTAILGSANLTEMGLAMSGEVGNEEHNLRSLGKAGAKRWRGIRPTVRGVAMNPVDHPHGGGEGRTSGGRHPVSPWGMPTKGYKTRTHKPTDQMIVRRRKV